jgi:hypothetical protein
MDGKREGAPQTTGFLGRSNLVTVAARTGVDLDGYLCDRN